MVSPEEQPTESNPAAATAKSGWRTATGPARRAWPRARSTPRPRKWRQADQPAGAPAEETTASAPDQGFPMLPRLEKILPPSAGRLTKYGKSSNHSNRLWSKWKKCRNWLNWRTARNPPTSVKLNHCAGHSEECSRRAATRTRRTNRAAVRIPQPPGPGGGSRREHCGNRTMVCAAFQSAPAIARRRQP